MPVGIWAPGNVLLNEKGREKIMEIGYNRQYVGARYVPMLFNYNGSSEWIPDYNYEALTIVTYGGSSYTSSKIVPANIGNPPSNPEYWVETGNFNAQLNEVTKKIAINKTVYTPEEFGAIGNGVADDTEAFIKAFSLLSSKPGAILDLKGKTYYISKIEVPNLYRNTVQNGTLKAIPGTIGDYLLKFNASPSSQLPLKVGYAETVFNNLTIDANHVNGMGCIYLNKYLEFKMTNVNILRFSTYGVYAETGYELNMSQCYVRPYDEETSINTSVIGVYLGDSDNIITSSVFVSNGINIKIDANAQIIANNHLYGSGVDIEINTNRVVITGCYFDGRIGLKINYEAFLDVIGCFFLQLNPAIMFDFGGNKTMSRIKFLGCTAYTTEDAPLMTFTNEPIGMNDCKFDITATGFTGDPTIYNMPIDVTHLNIMETLDSKNFYNLINNGLKITGVLSIYKFTYNGSVLNVTEFTGNDYQWLGFLLPIKPNTKYSVVNRSGTAFKIVGLNALSGGTQGTAVFNRESYGSSSRAIIFESGNFTYYMLSCYNEQLLDLDIREL